MAGFDPFGDAKRMWNTVSTANKAVNTIIKAASQRQERKRAEDQHRRHREEQQEVLRNPPPIHGSAEWAKPADLKRFLKGPQHFDNPSSLLLGAMNNDGTVEFVHWDDAGHLLTVGATRSGKAVTTIVPNLLRYKGSVIVIDPKSEHYALTSKWRAENVGPVYRLAPFDKPGDPKTEQFPNHGFNPLTRVKTQADARSLAMMMLPADKKSADFFIDDAVAFLTALILYIVDEAPKERCSLAAVLQACNLPTEQFIGLAKLMAKSERQGVAGAANNLLGKSDDRGLPNIRDTVHSKLSNWDDAQLFACLKQHDFNFEDLKDCPATIYIDVPFGLMKTHAPWLKVILKSALDAMLHNSRTPTIPVLFMLDEFLQLGAFPEFRDAIRTHASAGVRLWFFLQDISSLEQDYPLNAWRPFLNTSAKQFFGVDEPFTAELIGLYLGNTTVAYRSTNAGNNSSSKRGGVFDEDGNVSYSSGESVQFVGRPLLTPDEMMELLSDWKGDGWRHGIVHVRGPRPFMVRLMAFDKSANCMKRIGAHIQR